jgi:23S rRNA pseudouridine1911/1915/1917 synthase
MQHIGAPMVGDPVYGLRGIVPHRVMSQTLRDALKGFKRQALHAVRLGLIHPVTGEFMEWQAELPADMKALLEAMRFEEDVSEEDFELPFEVYDEDDFEDEFEDEEDVE